MFKVEALAAMLAANGITAPFAYQRAPTKPHRIITLVEIAGGFSEMQDELDIPYIQIRTRSERNEPQQARNMAHDIDLVLTGIDTWPADLGGYHTIAAGRLGGPPAFLFTDTELRAHYVCNYFLKQLK